MLRYNSDNIIVGYIKQLLYTFNLPKCKVFKTIDDLKLYASGKDRLGIVREYKNNMDYIVHLNSNDEITSSLIYKFDLYYPNITSNINLKTNLYDVNCHKYLGNYLRFIRDYKDINLMSMYNCYSGRTLSDNIYKYILIPVKYKTNYTIALTGKNYYITFLTDVTLSNIQKHFSNLGYSDYKYKSTFILKKKSNFNSSFLVTTNQEYDIFNEDNYYMVIRLPISKDFILTVLEGDYTKNNKNLTKIQFNFDKESNIDYDNVNFNKFINNFQLLDNKLIFKGESYPIADRLLEYLTDMVITPDDQISKNIIDAKYKVYENYGNNYYIEDGKKVYPYNHTKAKLGNLNDSFTNNERARFLDAIYQTKYQYKNTYDMLGYVDKDVESTINLSPKSKEVE